MSVPPDPSQMQRYRLQFLGSGSEYFRIWIVNWALILLTLGLYSPWAKVRREKYFHQQLTLDGSSFDFHANPWAILRGRIIALILLSLTLLDVLGGVIALLATVALYLIFPWMLRSSVRFRLANTSYRGIRFRFHGSTRETYQVFFALTGPLVVIIALLALVIPSAPAEQGMPGTALAALGGALVLAPLVLLPYAHGLWRRFVTQHAAFGHLRFAPGFSARNTAVMYLKVGGWAVALLVLLAILTSAISFTSPAAAFIVIPIAIVVGYATVLLYWPALTARLQNLWWPNTRLGDHYFDSELDVRGFLRLQAKNYLLTAMTLGLYRPFAVIDTLRMRAEAVSLLTPVSLEDVQQDFDAGDGRAIGEEAADFLGFDLSL
jgi:uncharacterized membrane protein YjgN (DUF898 family)